MPIANRFLSNHRVLNVKSPVFDPSGKLPTGFSSFLEIACTNFSSQIEISTSDKTLVQNWPAAKFLDIQPFIYVTQIEMPILIDKNGIRNNEISFFNDWLFYMTSTFDTIQNTGYNFASIIVENASVKISENNTSLSLSIKSNFPLNWGPSSFNGASTAAKTLQARKAKYYDTYVKFANYNSPEVTDNSVLGWNNKYGVQDFSVDYQSETETLYLTKHDLSDTMNINGAILSYPHRPDMINVKSVNCKGKISIFGPEMEQMGVSTQVYQNMSFMPVNQDIFSMALHTGSIQTYVGALNLNTSTTSIYNELTPLIFLPTGTLINKASTEFVGGQIYKHNREFTNILTNTPIKVLQDGTKISASLS